MFVVSRMSKPVLDLKLRVLAGEARALGPGKADLLGHIAETGSISAAAKKMDMSYSRAWQLVDQMNRAFKRPLVEAATGGKKGGGAALTEAGVEMLALYRQMEGDVGAAAAPFARAFQKHLK